MTHSFPTLRSSYLTAPAPETVAEEKPKPRRAPRRKKADIEAAEATASEPDVAAASRPEPANDPAGVGSEEHTSELQSLMRISYAVFCLKKKKKDINTHDIILNRTAYTTNTSTKNLPYPKQR